MSGWRVVWAVVVVGSGCLGKIDGTGEPTDTGVTVPGDTDTGATTVDTTPATGCSNGGICAAGVTDWFGPVAVTGTSACPVDYPTESTVLTVDPSADAAVCSCGCAVDSVSCELYAWDPTLYWSAPFAPAGACDTPPVDDACLDVVVEASCQSIPTETLPPVTWAQTDRACETSAPAELCPTGACYPPTDQLCVWREGDHTCPASFPVRSTYYRSFDDTRACSTCTCEPIDQRCSMDLEICSVSFFDLTVLDTDATDEHCLYSSDGADVTLVNTTISNLGSCSTAGGLPQGEVVPAAPVSVCCLN